MSIVKKRKILFLNTNEINGKFFRAFRIYPSPYFNMQLVLYSLVLVMRLQDCSGATTSPRSAKNLAASSPKRGHITLIESLKKGFG